MDVPRPISDEDEFEFTDALQEIVRDRKTIPMAIAEGVASLKDSDIDIDMDMDSDGNRLQEMEKALYRFFNARTGLRLLAEHHILSCLKRHGQRDNLEFRKTQSYHDNDHSDINNDNNNDNDNDINNDNDNDINNGTSTSTSTFIGCIQDNCDPYTEVRRVADQVAQHCRECYGIAPEIEVLDCTLERYADSNFTYVPHHLQYCIAELLKNSCRATIRRHIDMEEGTSTGTSTNFATEDHVGSHHHEEGLHVGSHPSLPSVKVVIAKGAEDVTIKIADKGGGVPRSILDKMWTFAHSTASDEIVQSKENDTSFETDEFSGGNIRGFGLPMARIYARYFGGELTLKSMEGYGVDAYLYLPVLGEACENLPKRVKRSPANHDSVHDGNHHHDKYAYAYSGSSSGSGDVFSSSFLSGEEPWNANADVNADASDEKGTGKGQGKGRPFERLDRIAI